MSSKGETQQRQAITEASYIVWDLRTQLQSLSPEQMSRYTRIEHLIGETMVALYPGVFTPKQQTYLTTPLTLILRRDQFDDFSSQWGTAPTKAQLQRQQLGGKIYLSYHGVNRNELVQETSPDGEIIQKPKRTTTGIMQVQQELLKEFYI